MVNRQYCYGKTLPQEHNKAVIRMLLGLTFACEKWRRILDSKCVAAI